MTTDKTLYTKNSIESVDPREFTRMKPGVYCGDTTYSTQLVVEIFSNAVDEYRLGHGDLIEVGINLRNHICVVTDRGQGFIPNESIRSDGKTILEASFSVLNTSGKYREDGTYEGTSLGSFGIGSKLTNFLSSELNVSTCRDGLNEVIRFEDGLFKKREVLNLRKNMHGTSVQWIPDPQFFTNQDPDISVLKKLFHTISCLCPGLTIDFCVDNEQGKQEQYIYFSKNGVNDLIDDSVKDNEVIKNRLIMNFEEGKYKMDLAMTYTSSYSSTIIPYVNTGATDSGPHITQIKTALTREMNKFFRDKKWLKDKDENLTGDDIQEGLYLIFNMTAPNVGYDAQVKSRIHKIETKTFINAFVIALRTWCETNEKDIKVICDKALNARKAREAAKKARDLSRSNSEKKAKKVLKFDSKLADASSKDRKKCEIYITEGDSASGNLKLARNKETQAILPVRGKILNVCKASLDKIQKNAEIMTMIDAFGLTVDPKTMKLTFKQEELRYGKIIIMSDADVDGRLKSCANEKLFA